MSNKPFHPTDTSIQHFADTPCNYKFHLLHSSLAHVGLMSAKLEKFRTCPFSKENKRMYQTVILTLLISFFFCLRP